MEIVLCEYTTTDGKSYKVWSTGSNTGDIRTEVEEDSEVKEYYLEENNESRII